MRDQFEFFWDGPCSQWYTGSIFEIDNVEYNCAEQYMMAGKAAFFEDEAILEEIMETDLPRAQKALGREVRGFDASRWDAVSRDVVYVGNMAKFSQSEHLLEYLLSTEDREIVEASPHDKIWGIGLREEDQRATDRSQWQGTNWLGEVCMAVRQALRIDPGPYNTSNLEIPGWR